MVLYKLMDAVSGGNGTTNIISPVYFVDFKGARRKEGILMGAIDDPLRIHYQMLLQGTPTAVPLAGGQPDYPYLNQHSITDAELASGDGGLVFAKRVTLLFPYIRGGLKFPNGPGNSWLWVYIPD